METVIYFLENEAKYIDTYFAERTIKAFKGQDIKSFIFPKFLQVQAI